MGVGSEVDKKGAIFTNMLQEMDMVIIISTVQANVPTTGSMSLAMELSAMFVLQDDAVHLSIPLLTAKLQ